MNPNLHVGRSLGQLGSVTLARATLRAERCIALVGAGAEAIAAGHRAAACDVVPRVLDAGEGWAALEGDAAFTLSGCLAVLPRSSVPYDEGIVVTWTLARAFAAAHARGVVLGAVGAGNLLVGVDGALRVVGFGAERGAWGAGAPMAPSVAAGRAPTPLTDLHAGLLFVRSLVPWVAGLPDRLVRMLAGEVGPFERSFQRALLGVLMLAGNADGTQVMGTLTRFWQSVGVTPNEAALAARLRGICARTRLSMGPEMAWFALDGGATVDLRRRRAARLVLEAIVAAAPAACRVESLVAAGWPGEVLVGNSGPDRLYVLLSTLRDLGLREVIARTDEGYALRPDVDVERC